VPRFSPTHIDVPGYPAASALKFPFLPTRDIYTAALLDHSGTIRIKRSRRPGNDQYWLQITVYGVGDSIAQWIRNLYPLKGNAGRHAGSLSGGRWQLSSHHAMSVLWASQDYLNAVKAQAALGMQFQFRMDARGTRRVVTTADPAGLRAEIEHRQQVMAEIAALNRAARAPAPTSV
jgi:hypothetical protein